MKLTRLFVSALSPLLIGACTSLSPHFDQQVGIAVNTAKAQQIVNPDASRNADPVAGIEGTPAGFAIGEYHNSFKAPPPTFQVIRGGI